MEGSEASRLAAFHQASPPALGHELALLLIAVDELD
jgi:hypothetical protein